VTQAFLDANPYFEIESRDLQDTANSFGTYRQNTYDGLTDRIGIEV
jgi:hypothetical protein